MQSSVDLAYAHARTNVPFYRHLAIILTEPVTSIRSGTCWHVSTAKIKISL